MFVSFETTSIFNRVEGGPDSKGVCLQGRWSAWGGGVRLQGRGGADSGGERGSAYRGGSAQPQVLTSSGGLCSGWYAFYWNAFLFIDDTPENFLFQLNSFVD